MYIMEYNYIIYKNNDMLLKILSVGSECVLKITNKK